MLQTTLLGPFVALSLFAEDDPRVAEQFVRNQGSGQTMPAGLQDLAREMDHMRMVSVCVCVCVGLFRFLKILLIDFFFSK